VYDRWLERLQFWMTDLIGWMCRWGGGCNPLRSPFKRTDGDPTSFHVTNRPAEYFGEVKHLTPGLLVAFVKCVWQWNWNYKYKVSWSEIPQQRSVYTTSWPFLRLPKMSKTSKVVEKEVNVQIWTAWSIFLCCTYAPALYNQFLNAVLNTGNM
jgi:hypothetical protein